VRLSVRQREWRGPKRRLRAEEELVAFFLCRLVLQRTDEVWIEEWRLRERRSKLWWYAVGLTRTRLTSILHHLVSSFENAVIKMTRTVRARVLVSNMRNHSKKTTL